jgi:predicted acetyltransferase
VLGSVDGAAASGAAVLMVDGYRYVALVATAPAHRRRGYAEAVMRRALEVAAAHGECPTVLHATDAGRPIYARMGYAPISTHTLYMDAALLSAH